MVQESKAVFISYRRRTGSFVARAVYQDLRVHGYDVFMDVESIDSGTFDTIILNQIAARAHFVVILTPGTEQGLERQGDWLRREIERAIELQRNVVPILANGFSFEEVRSQLTGKLAELSHYNGLTVPHEYFEEAMERLRTRFLKKPIYAPLVPTPIAERAAVQHKIEEANREVAPTAEDSPPDRVEEFAVYADLEDGLDTGLSLHVGQQIRISATGEVSIDQGKTWMRPDGLIVRGPHEGQLSREPNTHFDDQNGKGTVGALIGWVGESRDKSFLVGGKQTVSVDRPGNLHLGVNDSKGMYWDNVDHGNRRTYFTVRVGIFPPTRQPFEPEVVFIPAGEFLMGSDPSKDEQAYNDEQSQHILTLPDYYLARTPITNEQYLVFVQAAGQRAPEHWQGGKPPRGKEDHPVVYVSWRDALAYCQWLAQATGKPYALPSEAEWEKGARGMDGRVYPWGNQWDAARCNAKKGFPEGTTPVGAYPNGASPYGLLDMAGNVWEWTRTLGGKGYPYVPDDGRENLEASGTRVVRGGSFDYDARYVRCAFRYGDLSDRRDWSNGFRVCVVAQ